MKGFERDYIARLEESTREKFGVTLEIRDEKSKAVVAVNGKTMAECKTIGEINAVTMAVWNMCRLYKGGAI